MRSRWLVVGGALWALGGCVGQADTQDGASDENIGTAVERYMGAPSTPVGVSVDTSFEALRTKAHVR